MEKNSARETSDKNSDDEVKGYTLDQLIDKNSPFRRTNKKILTKPNPELSYYIKPPYHILKKNQKK